MESPARQLGIDVTNGGFYAHSDAPSDLPVHREPVAQRIAARKTSAG